MTGCSMKFWWNRFFVWLELIELLLWQPQKRSKWVSSLFLAKDLIQFALKLNSFASRNFAIELRRLHQTRDLSKSTNQCSLFKLNLRSKALHWACNDSLCNIVEIQYSCDKVFSLCARWERERTTSTSSTSIHMERLWSGENSLFGVNDQVKSRWNFGEGYMK